MSINRLQRLARFVPEMEDGKQVGLRTFGVRPDLLLGLLGLENGDRIETINGHPILRLEDVLLAYVKTHDRSSVDVVLQRRGQPMELVIRVC